MLSLAMIILGLPSVHRVEAQQPKKVPRIGFPRSCHPKTPSARVEAFQQGLRDGGYVEGQNIVVEYRSARESRIGSLSLRPSSFNSKLMSLSHRTRSYPRRRPGLRRSPS